jgi:YhcH/YjgK/YiaL family protein
VTGAPTRFTFAASIGRAIRRAACWILLEGQGTTGSAAGVILDMLSHSARYEALHPGFARAFGFLRTVDGTQPLGRHELDGSRCFGLVQSYETKPEPEALFEAHRKYIDVQFVFSGRETLLWAPVDSMREQTLPYDEGKDFALWKPVANRTPLHLSAGMFAILYPEDAHAPGLRWDGASQVCKVVVKVAVP